MLLVAKQLTAVIIYDKLKVIPCCAWLSLAHVSLKKGICEDKIAGE